MKEFITQLLSQHATAHNLSPVIFAADKERHLNAI